MKSPNQTHSTPNSPACEAFRSPRSKKVFAVVGGALALVSAGIGLKQTAEAASIKKAAVKSKVPVVAKPTKTKKLDIWTTKLAKPTIREGGTKPSVISADTRLKGKNIRAEKDSFEKNNTVPENGVARVMDIIVSGSDKTVPAVVYRFPVCTDDLEPAYAFTIVPTASDAEIPSTIYGPAKISGAEVVFTPDDYWVVNPYTDTEYYTQDSGLDLILRDGDSSIDSPVVIDLGNPKNEADRFQIIIPSPFPENPDGQIDCSGGVNNPSWRRIIPGYPVSGKPPDVDFSKAVGYYPEIQDRSPSYTAAELLSNVRKF